MIGSDWDEDENGYVFFKEKKVNFEHNFKDRELYCKTCKAYYSSNQAAPRCPECKEGLITAVRSVLTGELITGPEKLRIVFE